MGNVTHSKVSTIADGSDTDLVLPSDWNAAHSVSTPTVGSDVATKDYVDDADEVYRRHHGNIDGGRIDILEAMDSLDVNFDGGTL